MPRINTFKDAERYAAKRDDVSKAKPKPRQGVEAGLYSGRQHPKEMVARDEHEPQLLGEEKTSLRAKNYDNYVKDGWLRGSGSAGATAKPGFDHGPVHGGPSPKGGKCTASGKDMQASPFSKANKMYWGD